MARSKSSRRWLKEHFNDAYVRRAQEEGWRSRAVFKLMELQDKDRLIKPGMRVVDLGAAPGGWSQYAASLQARKPGAGVVIGLDILPMEPLEGVEFICADFTEDEALTQLQALCGGEAVDLVLSDMAPNISGMAAVDQPRAMYLAELAFDFAVNHLKQGGDFVVKLFQGEGFDALLKQLREAFEQVVIRKPAASRPRSREVYAVARRLKRAAAAD